MAFEDKLRKLKLLVFDVDGILTDNSVYMGADGAEFKRFYIADGFAFYLAQQAGLKVALVSGRFSAATDSRAKELSVEDVYQGYGEKSEVVADLLRKYEIGLEETMFMGDDLVDIAVMKKTEVSVTVPDSAPQVRAVADYTTSCPGGRGAVREIVNMILEAKGIDVVELWDSKYA